jgi:transposase
MFVRQRKNKSGSISVQIIDKSSGKYKVVETIGCAKNSKEVEFYVAKGVNRIKQLEPNLFDVVDFSKKKHRFLNIPNKDISIVGPDIIFGYIMEYIGCNKALKNLKDKELFTQLVISRIIDPGSKLNLIDYMYIYKHTHIEKDNIYRFLDTLSYQLKDKIEQCIFEYTTTIVGSITVSFYDVTTLYFEASSEDDLRKVGFSKDGKFTKPQILLGLLTSLEGYPLGFEIHEGNKYEGKTFIPILQKFQKKFNIDKPIVVADSGLLSKNNIIELERLEYKYILGARIKSSSNDIKNKIISLNLNEKKDIDTIVLSKTQKMIISYTLKRAKKDKYTREKNFEKLKIKVKSGNLTKSHLNNKGYNKYLTLSDSCQTTLSINEQKYNYDSQFDGLKGFITNDFSLSPNQIIDHYTNLWHIERAFRISKTDLKIRPIYHRLENRIYSHILISFVAYTVYKEFERKLKINNISIKRKSTIGFIKSMYGIVQGDEISLMKLSHEQQLIYNLFYDA